MMTTTPTPDEKVQASRMLAELHAQGYQDDTTHKLQPGARIRHTGHQYPGAFIHGTGVVLHVTIKPDSPWTDTHHTPDVEVIVLWDRPHLTPSRLATLSSYHVRTIDT